MRAARKKLIEVALPLEAVNAEAIRRKQKSPKGYPTSIHKYWAQRPLAACRAILFSQLVDDPSSWPEKFPSQQAQADERSRLHRLIDRLVAWDVPGEVLNEARWEIARSIAWGRNQEPPSITLPREVSNYIEAYGPTICDPFCGAGSIPLEAQRLGLSVKASDINPIATLISKLLVEVPNRFAGRPPINPLTRENLINGSWAGFEGLAADVRFYGDWIRDEAEKRIGQFYPPVTLPDGSVGTVVAWIWARTVRSPDPAAKGAHVPLVSTFVLSSKESRKVWLRPIVDRSAGTFTFQVQSGPIPAIEDARIRSGTRASAAGQFKCLLTGSPISGERIRAEARAGRMDKVLLAIAVDRKRDRTYISPTLDHQELAERATPPWMPDGELFPKALGFRVPNYGLTRWQDLFTRRQLLAHATFCDLLKSLPTKIVSDAGTAWDPGELSLNEGGSGLRAYSEAVTSYLACALSRMILYGSTLCGWLSKDNAMGQTMPQQILKMTWDFAEGNPFGRSSAGIKTCCESIASCVSVLQGGPKAVVSIRDAAAEGQYDEPVLVSTDPPYYDNVGYADLSDFFYVWHRHALCEIWPELFRRLETPKREELVATPHRHGGRAEADQFFLHGMSVALRNICEASTPNGPSAIYYSFKQEEEVEDGITSAGWASFLQATVNSGMAIVGTWPLRTESEGRLRTRTSNALASSIVLVCRNRERSARIVTRDDFVRALRTELPEAIRTIRASGVGPVDMAQSVIGPGMEVFSRYKAVLEDTGGSMQVRTALALINQIRDEIDHDDDAAYDAETRFALDWFGEAGWEFRDSGRAILLANAKNLALDRLSRLGLIETPSGRTRLTPRDVFDPGDDAADLSRIVWLAAQHLAHALVSAEGGQEKAADIFARLSGILRELVRALAYRLYGLAERKGWAQEALVWNRLAEEWVAIEGIAKTLGTRPPLRGATPDLFGARP